VSTNAARATKAMNYKCKTRFGRMDDLGRSRQVNPRFVHDATQRRRPLAALLFIYDKCRIDIYDKSRRLLRMDRLPRSPKKPTNAEVAILRVLWSRGPSTVREVAQAMGREAAYTTVLKLMQNMTDKRLVRRDESSRTHVYTAACPEEQTQRQIVTDLVDRVFDGSAAKLVMQALAASQTSPKELEEIQKLIDTHRRGRR
jgi:predicted transcriptional regulator